MTIQHPPTAPVPAAPSDPQHEKWRVVVAKSADEARQGTAPVLAATGLAIWCIQQYAFHGDTPLPVSAAMWTLIPTLIGWLSTHVAFRKVTL